MPVALKGSTSGDITLAAPAVAGTNTITLPATTGTAIVTTSTPVAGDALVFDGTDWVGGPSTPWKLIGNYTASAQTVLQVSNLSLYKTLRITFHQIRTTSSQTPDFTIRFSTDNNATVLAGTLYAYRYDYKEMDVTPGSSSLEANGANRLVIANLPQNQNYQGQVLITNIGAAGVAVATGSGSYTTSTSVGYTGTFGGMCNAGVAVVNALRLNMLDGSTAVTFNADITVEGVLA